MKHKSPDIFCLLAVCLIASCRPFSELDFNLETASPQKNLVIRLEGREQSSSTVQQVKLTALRRSEVILVDDKFYREESDH
jgi:hypothetical protein